MNVCLTVCVTLRFSVCVCDSDDVDNRGSTEHMRVGRIAITQPLGTVMPLYHTRGGRIHLCVYLCEVPQCIRNI